jgi:hypothetical protein
VNARQLEMAGEWPVVDQASPLVVASTLGVPPDEVAIQLAVAGLLGVDCVAGCVWYYLHGGTARDALAVAAEASRDAGLEWLTWRGAVS